MRIRTIKPEFWSHPVMGKLEDASKLLAIGLLNYCDDEGYFYAEDNLLRSALRPFDDDSTIIRASRKTLENIGYIELSESPTHGLLGRVKNFTNHQRVDRPKQSHIKELYNSAIDRRLIDDDSPLEGKGMEGKGSNKELVDVVVENWNLLPEPFPKIQKLSDGRKKALNARLKDEWWGQNYQGALKLIPGTKFLEGKNERGWVADFDWFIRPDTLPKIMEGKYVNKNGTDHCEPSRDLSTYVPK